MCWISLYAQCVEVTVIDSKIGGTIRTLLGLSYGVSSVVLAVECPVSLIVTVMVVSFPAFSVELRGPRQEPDKISGERPRMEVLESEDQMERIERINVRDLTEASDGIGKKRATGSCDGRW